MWAVVSESRMWAEVLERKLRTALLTACLTTHLTDKGWGRTTTCLTAYLTHHKCWGRPTACLTARLTECLTEKCWGRPTACLTACLTECLTDMCWGRKTAGLMDYTARNHLRPIRTHQCCIHQNHHSDHLPSKLDNQQYNLETLN